MCTAHLRRLRSSRAGRSGGGLPVPVPVPDRMAMELAWWPLAPWLSPAAAWFVFFSAVVGAIAVMSCNAEQGGGVPSRRRLCRNASSVVLDRLRSFCIFPAAGGYGGVAAPAIEDVGAADVSVSGYYCCCTQEAEEVPAPPEVCTVAPATTSSRVAGESAPVACTVQRPSAPVETAAAEDGAPLAMTPAPDGEEEEEDNSISLDEAYALVQLRRPQQSPSPSASAAGGGCEATTSRPRKAEPAKATKRRARACRRRGEEALQGMAEVNARAERFIRQFREELKLQRLNSVLSHTQVLSPRAGAPTAAR